VNLTTQQRYTLLEKHSCYITEICDACGKGIGPVRYTRQGDSGVWCSRECCGDQRQETVRRRGRPRRFKTNADRQRAYRKRITVS
jgi:hypothetical protein